MQNLWQWVLVTERFLTEDWRERLEHYDTLFVGFSGGLDSTVLLHDLVRQPTLAKKIQAIHIHHGLSAHADVWQTHCQTVCDALSIPLVVCRVAFERTMNIEEHARTARYQAFSSKLSDKDCLLLAHHSDDQAETLLLQLLRGAGIDGMAAMAPIKSFVRGALVRPLLPYTRQMLETYAEQHKLRWVEDDSNQDLTFSRNYLRQQVMPLLKAKWPGVVDNLQRTAAHCQHAKTNLEALAEIDAANVSLQESTLELSSSIRTLDNVRLTNVVRTWLKKNQVRLPSTNRLQHLIDDVILASDDAMPLMAWDDVVLRRYQDRLYLLKHEATIERFASIPWLTFPAALSLPGGRAMHAALAEEGLLVPKGCRLHIGFRQGGELFDWRGQTKQLKKLLQQWHIPPWQRDEIPLLYIDDHLAAVVGYAISDKAYATGRADVYRVYMAL